VGEFEVAGTQKITLWSIKDSDASRGGRYERRFIPHGVSLGRCSDFASYGRGCCNVSNSWRRSPRASTCHRHRQLVAIGITRDSIRRRLEGRRLHAYTLACKPSATRV